MQYDFGLTSNDETLTEKYRTTSEFFLNDYSFFNHENLIS